MTDFKQAVSRDGNMTNKYSQLSPKRGKVEYDGKLRYPE